MEIRLKRFLSLAMAIIMVIGMMPTNVVFAEETESCDHNYADGVCGVCGAADPDYVAPHQHTYQYACSTECSTCTEGTREATHTYVDGKCECGETDPNYQPPHQHSFVEGKCTCGETDPNYQPPHQHSFVEGKCTCGETDPDWTPADGAKNGGDAPAISMDAPGLGGNTIVELSCEGGHNVGYAAYAGAYVTLGTPTLVGGQYQSTITVDLSNVAELISALDANHSGYTHTAPADMPEQVEVIATWNGAAWTFEKVTYTVSCTAASGGEGGDEIPPEDTTIDTEAELIAAIAKGGEVVLEGDITLTETLVIAAGNTVVLNLNGKTLSAENKNVIKNDGGTLTIKNGTVKRTGETAGYAMNIATGTLRIEDAIIDGGLYTSGTSVVALNANISQHHASRHAIYAYNCAVTLNGGTYHNDNAGNSTIMAAGSSVVTINGGTYSIKNGKQVQNWTSCMLDANEGGAYIINSGTFKGHFRIQNGSSMTINGGTFENTHGEAYAIYGNVAVKGGTFTDAAAKNFAKTYLAANHELGEDGKVTKLPVIAMIGDVEYFTLADAFAAAQDNDKIELLKDISYTSATGVANGSYLDGLVYTGDKSFTVDFKGHTITENGDINDYLVYLKNTGSKDNEIIFTNGKIVINSASKNTAWAAIAVGANSSTAKTTLNLNGMEVVNGNPNDENNQVIRVRKGSTVNLNSGTVVTSNGTSYGVVAETNSTLNINNGAKVVQTNSKTTSGNQVYTAVSGNGIINVNDGAVIESDNYGIHNLTTGNTVINIKGGTITAPVAVHTATNSGAGETAIANITGGTINGKLETYTSAASIKVSGGTFSVDPTAYVVSGYEVTGEGPYTVAKIPPVAMIGDVEYFTLADAFAAGGDIVVLKDIVLTEGITVPAGKTVTLDLNGKTVSMVDNTSVSASRAMIHNKGNLTIKDSAENGKLSYQYTGTNLGTDYYANTITSDYGSVLTVLSGTIENLTYDSGMIAYAIDGLTNGNGGDVTLNICGGTITSKRQAVRIFANSTTKTGTLNISGGTFIGRVIIQNANTNANKAVLSITNGTFNANAYKSDVLYVGGTNSATIDLKAAVTGGTFNGEITKTNVKGFISGGTFSVDPTAYVVSGYEVTGEGPYTIALKKVDVKEPENTNGFVNTDANVNVGAGTILEDIIENEAITNVVNENEGITLVITPVSVEVEEAETVGADYKTAVITYNVSPIDVASGNKVSEPDQPISFNLPIPGSLPAHIKYAEVYHGTERLTGDQEDGTFTIHGEGGSRYITIKDQKTFSEFKAMPIDIDIANDVAKINNKGYQTLPAAFAAAKTGDTIKLLKNVELTAGMSILEKNLTLDLNGKTFKGDLLGTIAINGGTYITPQNYKMMGPDADYYKTTDAVFSMTDIKGSITLHSGNVIMVPDEWWTLEGQTLTIDAGATFEIPAGKTMQVLSTVIINGTAKVDGTVNLYIASATVKAAEGLNIVTSVADHKVAYQDGTYKVVPKVYVAQLGETKYESVADALAAAVEAGMTDVTITLIGETTQASAVALDDAFNLYTLEKFNSVTINQADATKPYYIAGIYTGSRTNGGKFIFDGVNITVIDQYIFEGNVALTNNSVVKSVSDHNCFNYYGNVTVEPGSKLLGVIDEARGGKYTIDGGKTDGSYNTTPDMQDAILSISWNGDSITLKNGAYVKVNAANEVGRMTLGAGAVANIVASKLDAWEYINMAAGSAMNMDTESLITTKKVTGTGVITIDAANMTESVQVINADMSGFAGTIEVINNEYALYEITETGVMVVVGAASVNGKAYKTLTDAFAAVNENTEESVVMNINAGTYAPTENEQLIVTRDNVTIQGAGQDKTTIACGDFTCAGQAGLLIQGSNVTVKDLTVTSSATNAIKVTKIEENNSLPMVKNVAITNVTATSTKGHGLNLHGVEGAAINGLTATGSKCGIALASATGVEISGTKAAGGWGAIGMMYADGAAYALPCELTLGENNELGLIYSERSTEAKDEITLTAAAPATLRINNLTVAAGEEFLPEGVTEAKVGNYYASLANAMAVAKEGDTVELLTDVEIGTQLVLDKQLITLSGGEEKHTIKAAAGFVKGEYSKHLIDVRADGIVVKDLFIDGNNLASGIQFYGCQANIGNVTVENAKGWAAMQLNGAMLEIFDDVDVSSTSNTWPLIAVEYGAHNPARETVLIVSTDATVDGMIYIDPNGAKLAESQGVQMTVSGELDSENVSAVARIDSTYYGNLEAAVKAAREGDIVEVLTDVTLTERIEITKDVILAVDKPVTITVSIASGSTGEPFGGLHVTNGTLSLWGDLTVTNVGSQDGGVSTITATGANANVIVDGATVKSECKNNAIEASNGAYVIINGGEVLGTQYTAAYASGGATIHVDGGVVKAEGKYGLIASKTAATTGGNIIISGGEVTHVLVHESADSSAIIYGGKIYGTVKAANGANMHIVAGWFENSPLNKEGVTLDPGMTWTEDNKYIHHGEYVAFIDADDDGIVDEGEQGFATIEDALKAEGKTIKLLNHVKKALTIENDVTLDLNGYTIETALTGTNDSAIHVKSGNVVITDNSGSGEFVIQATGNGFAMVIDAGANVTLDNVIMVGHSAGVVTYGNLTLGENSGVTATEITEGCGDGVRAYGNAVVTLNGGVAVAAMEDMEHGYGIALYQNAKAIINDGAAAGKSGVCVYGGTLEVNGGYVVGGTEYAILTSSYGDDSVIGSAKVTINDGIVVGKIVVEKDYLNKDLSDYSASVSIKGGQFERIELIVEDETKDIYSLEVSGGIFENPVPEKRCAPGYIPCENENGTYGVVLNTTRIIDLSNVHDSKINSSEIFVDGVEYTIVNNKIEIDRELAKKTAMFVTSYEYKTGTAGEYPSAMYVWFVKGVDNDGDGVCDTYAAERVSALDNFFQYHGTSIRVGTAKNGIRFFSSVNAADAEKLMKGTLITSGNLNGAKMVKAGTWFKITKEGRSEVYGGAVGNSFRVFQTDKGRNWFTGVLTGLDSNAAKIKEDISSRPYADIQIGNETISLYGGIVVRSIYDVATQNKDVFTAGTAHDDFIENLIKLGNTSN